MNDERATSRTEANEGRLNTIMVIASVVALMALFNRKRRLPLFGWMWGRFWPLTIVGLVMMLNRSRSDHQSQEMPPLDRPDQLLME
jgi:hypothetical protein